MSSTTGYASQFSSAANSTGPAGHSIVAAAVSPHHLAHANRSFLPRVRLTWPADYVQWRGEHAPKITKTKGRSSMLDKAPNAQLNRVLSRLDDALAAGDIDAAVALFQDDCYWRDLVTFTWNIRTMEGQDADSRHAEGAASSVRSRPTGRWPRARTPPRTTASLEGWISFETERRPRLRPHAARRTD